MTPVIDIPIPISPVRSPSPLPKSSMAKRVSDVCPYPTRRFSVAEYHRLIELGFFDDDKAYELVSGWIIKKMTRKPPHDVALEKSEDAIREILPAGWRVRTQKAIELAECEPEPDIAIVLGPPDRYRDHHPHIVEIAFIVEVADRSLNYDRGEKLRIYAESGLPVYWIINVNDRQIEVYSDPVMQIGDPTYRKSIVYSADDVIPLTIQGVEVARIAVSKLLPAS